MGVINLNQHIARGPHLVPYGGPIGFWMLCDDGTFKQLTWLIPVIFLLHPGDEPPSAPNIDGHHGNLCGQNMRITSEYVTHWILERLDLFSGKANFFRGSTTWGCSWAYFCG